MKTIYFLRHAKSSWDDFELKDYDRPLSTRGIQDADLMGNYFRSKKIKLDLVLSSPSKRTKETLEHFFQFEKPKVQFEESIYHASLDQILGVIFSVPETIRSIMLVGHNPSMHEITEYLSNKFINKYPTCCLASLTIDTDWNKAVRGCADMNFLKKPSELR
tara:strand:+ start:1493 stop:1975 length:483 start_codon:yes stop_codon:yes gene_type:complete